MPQDVYVVSPNKKRNSEDLDASARLLSAETKRDGVEIVRRKSDSGKGDAFEEKKENVAMERSVGLVSAIAIIVGTMIGSGIFVSPSGLLERTGSVTLCLIVWAACGVLAMLGALSYCELSAIIPRSGGEISYFKDAFSHFHPFWGPLPSFLFSWVSAVLLKPAQVAIISMAFAEYSLAPFIVHSDPEWRDTIFPIAVKLLTIVCICLLCFINCYSAKLATQVQVFFTVAKLIAIVVIIVSGMVRIGEGFTSELETGFQGTTTSSGDIATAFYSGLFAYDGWNNLNFITEELKEPHKNLPRAILIGLPLVTVSYVLVNVAYLTVMTKAELIASSAVAVDYGNVVLGVASFTIPIFVALSTIGAANGMTFSSGRISYVASREKQLADVLSCIDINKLTPSIGIIFNSLIAIIMVIPGNIESLIDFFSFTAWIFYALAMVALLTLRKTMPDAPRSYKVPIIAPILVLLVSLYLVIAPIIEKPAVEYLYACLFMVLGVFYYIPFVYKKIKFGTGRLTSVLQLIFLVAPENRSD